MKHFISRPSSSELELGLNATNKGASYFIHVTYVGWEGEDAPSGKERNGPAARLLSSWSRRHLPRAGHLLTSLEFGKMQRGGPLVLVLPRSTQKKIPEGSVLCLVLPHHPNRSHTTASEAPVLGPGRAHVGLDRKENWVNEGISHK